jgi:hypothetical protein
MTTPPVRVERRVGQRFPYHLAVRLRQPGIGVEGAGFTQDLSSKGVFLFTDAALSEGAEIELTLRMPSEITLGDNMLVRCRGRVLRVVRPGAASGQDRSPEGLAQTKIGVAVRLEGYEYLAESEEPCFDASRTSSPQLYRDQEDRPVVQLSARGV